MFVKLIDRYTIEAWIPPVLVTNGRTYVHPTPEVLRQNGYLPLAEETPAEGLCTYSSDGSNVFVHREEAEV